MKSKLFSLCLLLIFSIQLFAQDYEPNLKKVTKEDLQMNVYKNDSSATAVILFDKGFSYFSYDNHKESFKLNFERQMRIKFLTKESFEFADIKIPLYKNHNQQNN